MSLLLLKTKDLTWQDHTMNTEVMLAPARSGLLLNKHKALDAKCQAERQLYERQRAQCLKEFVISRRLLDRQRLKLLHRQRALGVDAKQARLRSALASSADLAEASERQEREAETTSASRVYGQALKERSASAPGGLGLGGLRGLPAIYIDTGRGSPYSSESSGFFVTEVASDTSDTPLPLPVVSHALPWGGSGGHLTSRLSYPAQRGTSKSATTFKREKPIGILGGTAQIPGKDAQALKQSSSGMELREPLPRPPGFGVRFAASFLLHGEPPRGQASNYKLVELEEEVRKDLRETMNDPELEKKVRDFVDDLQEFTKDQQLEEGRKSKTGLSTLGQSAAHVPLVAKRYNSWHVDKTALLAAFEKFCAAQTREELNKVVRLAAKLKANVKATRDQSIVPSVVTIKASRTFLSLANSPETQAPQLTADEAAS